MKHTLATRTGDTQVTMGSRPVHTFTLDKEMDYVEPQKRVY